MGWLDWMKKRDREVLSGEIAPNQKPSWTQSKYSGLFDRLPSTEAELKRDEALFDMALIVHHIAKDPDSNWGKYKGAFENAVSELREAFEMHRQPAGKGEPNAAPRDAQVERADASPQKDRGGRER